MKQLFAAICALSLSMAVSAENYTHRSISLKFDKSNGCTLLTKNEIGFNLSSDQLEDSRYWNGIFSFSSNQFLGARPGKSSGSCNRFAFHTKGWEIDGNSQPPHKKFDLEMFFGSCELGNCAGFWGDDLVLSVKSLHEDRVRVEISGTIFNALKASVVSAQEPMAARVLKQYKDQLTQGKGDYNALLARRSPLARDDQWLVAYKNALRQVSGNNYITTIMSSGLTKIEGRKGQFMFMRLMTSNPTVNESALQQIVVFSKEPDWRLQDLIIFKLPV